MFVDIAWFEKWFTLVMCTQESLWWHLLTFQQVSRGYIRCDYFIVTHCIIVWDVIWWLFIFINGHIHRLKITGDGQMDGWTRPLIEITWFSPPIRLIWILLSVNSRYITYNFFSSNSMDQLRKKTLVKSLPGKFFFFS